jgi:hypothetical protein
MTLQDVTRRWIAIFAAIVVGLPIVGFGSSVLGPAIRGAGMTSATTGTPIDLVALAMMLWLPMWPFPIIGWLLILRIRNDWPYARRAQGAALGSTIGWTLPYAATWGLHAVLTGADAAGAAQFLLLYLFVLCPIAGAILGAAGWLVGRFASGRRPQPGPIA